MANANIKAVITAEDKASGVLRGFAGRVDQLGDRVVSTMKTASVAFGAAAAAATTFAVKSAADFEQTRIGLENMLGSADAAREMLAKVSKFAAETPFEFPELAQATRQLVAFGFSGEDAFETMQQLGDVSAAIGAPINDLAYLMGTLRAQGRAFTIDIRQFAMRGIPIYEYLAKVLQTNTKELTTMIEEGKVGFPEVQKAFQLMTAEGGKFHNTMQRQSRSLSGLFSTLKDNIGMAARELVGITQEGDIKEGSLFARLQQGVTTLNANLPKLIETMKSAIRDIIPQFQQWAGVISDVANRIGDYLGPKLAALWGTLKDDLIPALTTFWQDILLPLVPVIGTVLVGALGFAIDALNILLDAFSGLINFLRENEVVFWAIVGVLGAIRLALFLQGALEAFKGVMAGVAASYKTTAALVTTPMVMPAIAVGAALVALQLVLNKAQEIQRTLDRTNSAMDGIDKSLAQARAQYERGDISKERYNAILKGAYSGLPGRASGGPVSAGQAYMVGEQGPEMFIPNRTGGIVPTSSLGNSTVNVNFNVGMYTGTEVEKRKVAKELWSALQDAAKSKGMTANQLVGL